MKRLKRWIRFRLDSLVLGGVGIGASLLAVITAAVVALCGLVFVVGGVRTDSGEEVSFFEASWWSLMRTLDPGTMGGDAGWLFRVTSLAATIAGILVLSVLIGVITAGIDSRLVELRRGRGSVQLVDHTVILGWSPGTETLVSELAEANRSRHRPAIVILSESDVSKVKDELTVSIRENKDQRVFVRSGSTTDENSLRSVSAEDARAIVILHGNVQNPDAENVRTTLAVVNELPDFYGAIVTQVSDRSLADALRESTSGRVLVVSRKEVMSKVTSQVCRSRGLAQVYEDLLDFEGSEIYVKREPGLVGRTFGVAVMSYPKSIPIGILRDGGTADLCPDWESRIGENDEIIAISEDDSTFSIGALPHGAPSEVLRTELVLDPRSVLLIGWSEIATGLVDQLDEILPAGSSITVCAPNYIEGVATPKSVALESRDADINRLNGLSELVYEQAFDNIVLLCSRDRSVVEDDSVNLMRLLELRQILGRSDCPSRFANVVTELRDVEDVAIAGSSRDDFVVSDRISSLLLAQLAEEPKLLGIFNALFEARGVEILTLPASQLFEPQTSTFGGLVGLGMPFGIVIGFATAEEGTVVNPSRDLEVVVDDSLRIILLTRPSHRAKN